MLILIFSYCFFTCVRKVEIIPIFDFPDVKHGDDVGLLIVESCRRCGIDILDNDIIVIASKIISKAEGLIIDLRDVKPSTQAYEISKLCNLDPRLVEVIIREGEVLKVKSGLLITFTRGIVCGNSGVDFSNVDGSGVRVALLPKNPDESARRVRFRIRELTGRDVAVIITDTCGRPFRRGAVNFAIGISGIRPFRSYVGRRDRYGYEMTRTSICIVDEIAAAAELVMGQGDEGIPVVIVRGLEYEKCEECSINDVVMPREDWLFR